MKNLWIQFLMLLVSILSANGPYRRYNGKLCVHTDVPQVSPLAPLCMVVILCLMVGTMLAPTVLCAMVIPTVTLSKEGPQKPKDPSKETDESRGVFPVLEEILPDKLGLKADKLSIVTFPVSASDVDPDSDDRKAVGMRLRDQLEDVHTVLHYNNQLNWVFIKHQSWTKGTSEGMNKLFKIKKGLSPTLAAKKCYKRICTLLLADTQHYTTDLVGLNIRIFTEKDLDIAANLFGGADPEAYKRRFRQFTDGATLGSKMGFYRITRYLEDTANLGTCEKGLRIAFQDLGIAKGNIYCLHNLAYPILVFEWNITKEVLPTFNLFRTSKRYKTTRPRTDWQSCLANFPAIGQWLPVMVQKYYEEILEATKSKAALLAKLEDLLPEVDQLTYEDADDVTLSEEIKDIVSFVKACPDNFDPLASRELRSKLAKAFGGGSVPKRQVQGGSVVIPHNWAHCGNICPDLSGFTPEGYFDPEQAQLGPNEVYYAAPVADGTQLFGYRWPVGSPREHFTPIYRITEFYQHAVAGTTFINWHDSEEWAKTVGGWDYDDVVVLFNHQDIVKETIEGVKDLSYLGGADEDFLNTMMVTHKQDKRQLTWKLAAELNVRQFESGDVVSIGMFAYMLGRILMVARNLPKLLKNKSVCWLSKSPTTKRHWSKCLSWMSIKDQIVTRWTPDGPKELDLHSILKAFQKNLPKYLCLLLPGVAEQILDAANGKPKIKIGVPQLDPLKLLETLKHLMRALPGPRGRYSKGGWKFNIPEVDWPLYGPFGKKGMIQDRWASDPTTGSKSCVAKAQMYLEGEGSRPPAIAALLKAGYHYVESSRDKVGEFIKLKLRPALSAAWETGSYPALLSALWDKVFADYKDPEPKTYCYTSPTDKDLYYMSETCWWLKHFRASNSEKDAYGVEGAILVADRMNAKLMKALHALRSNNIPTPTIPYGVSTIEFAQELLYGWWEASMADLMYAKGSEPAKPALEVLRELKLELKPLMTASASVIFIEEHLGMLLSVLRSWK